MLGCLLVGDWIVVVVALVVGEALGLSPREFISMNHSAPALFVLEGSSPEMLFVPEPGRTVLDCGQPVAVDASGNGVGVGAGDAIAIAGYVRPDTVSRFCMRGDGTVDSFRSRRRFRFGSVSRAPRAPAALPRADSAFSKFK